MCKHVVVVCSNDLIVDFHDKRRLGWLGRNCGRGSSRLLQGRCDRVWRYWRGGGRGRWDKAGTSNRRYFCRVIDDTNKAGESCQL